MDNTSRLATIDDLWASGWSTYQIGVHLVCSEAEIYNALFGRGRR